MVKIGKVAGSQKKKEDFSMDTLSNLRPIDDALFDMNETDEADTELPTKIHLRVQQRNAKKNITVIEGLKPDVAKKVGSDLRTKLGCSGTVKDGCVQFSGDQRQKIVEHLLAKKIVDKDALVIHGF